MNAALKPLAADTSNMASKEVTLAVSEFLDSQHADVQGMTREDVRSIAEIFLTICYDDLGKKPRLLDDQDVHVALGHQMPARLKRRDPLAEHVPTVLRAYLKHLEETETVPQAFEIRRALAATEDEFLETVRTGKNTHHVHERQAPVVHQAPKVGRNDPCFCGSGKKFKKCCGKQG